MKILIADDDLVSRRLLERTLVALGHEVTAVGDGISAMAALLGPDGPRVAILDWMMPGATGLEVCRLVRKRPVPYVYILLLTARDRREDLVAGLDAGADDFLTKPFDALELRARLRPGERIVDLQEGLIQAREALRELAIRDSLTGLWNRRMILDQLGSELSRARRDGKPLAVAVADLDHFKRVNDSFGHATGDAVLREAAKRMRSAVRDCDFIGRYGGEEFLLVLPGCDGRCGLLVAERVRGRVAAEPVRTDEAPVPTTVSLGLAWSATARATADALIDAADEALYRAKAEGRNRVAEPAEVGDSHTEVSIPCRKGPCARQAGR
ncbi:MAG: GGDEF domain-containing protein [Thermoanaerobaculia bacterium]